MINNGSKCRAEPVAHYETGKEAIMNCTVYNAGKYFILFAGMEGNCQVYKIRHELMDEETVKQNKSGNYSIKIDMEIIILILDSLNNFW